MLSLLVFIGIWIGVLGLRNGTMTESYRALNTIHIADGVTVPTVSDYWLTMPDVF